MLAAGCAAPAPAPRYHLGAPYALGGVWYYPREDFALAETGLAAVAADTRPGRVTANGEIHDPGRASAAHRTLQLPVALRVTNLENGRSLLLRANDRGPAHPGRVIELSRRAAELLGIPPGGTAQVRLAVAPEESLALAAALRAPRGGERADAPAAGAERPLVVAAAPRAAVSAEALPPPPGARAAPAPANREAAPAPPAATGPAPAAPAPPPAFPERVEQGPPAPGRLFIETGTFSRREFAAQQALRLARLGARVEAAGQGRRQQFRVRIGPLPGVAEADRTLEQAFASGVSEARILVDDAAR
nr:RlpA-like double-psi beta-barrel domain-containing protein [Caldovatus aquaticus]